MDSPAPKDETEEPITLWVSGSELDFIRGETVADLLRKMADLKKVSHDTIQASCLGELLSKDKPLAECKGCKIDIIEGAKPQSSQSSLDYATKPVFTVEYAMRQKAFLVREIKLIIKQLLFQITNLRDQSKPILHPSNIILAIAGDAKVRDSLPVSIPLSYSAPELLLGNPYESATEIWQVGCLMAEFLSACSEYGKEVKRQPLFGENNFEVLQLSSIFETMGTPEEKKFTMLCDTSIYSQEKKDLYKSIYKGWEGKPPIKSVFTSVFLSDSGLDLLRKLLEFFPNERICAEDALVHPWFMEFSGPAQMVQLGSLNNGTRHIITAEYATRHKTFSVREIKFIIKQLLLEITNLREWFKPMLHPSNLILTFDGNVEVRDLLPISIPLSYGAPELLLGIPYHEEATEIWQVGCVMAELLSVCSGRGEVLEVHTQPLFGENNFEVVQLSNIFQTIGTPVQEKYKMLCETSIYSEEKNNLYKSIYKKWKGKPLKKSVFNSGFLSDLSIDLLRKLLEFFPEDRICAKDALDHPWLSEL